MSRHTARVEPGNDPAAPAAPDAVEVRHLRAFVAVAEELNFSRAAERLYLSQPALSRQIRMLERLVGCELLRRTTRHVELTLAGEALLDRAGPVLAALDEAVAAAQTVGGELNARIMQAWTPMMAIATARPGRRPGRVPVAGRAARRCVRGRAGR